MFDIQTEQEIRDRIFKNIKSDLDGCSFENCWHYNRNTNIDPENNNRRMFTADSCAIGCKVTNSANII